MMSATLLPLSDTHPFCEPHQYSAIFFAFCGALPPRCLTSFDVVVVWLPVVVYFFGVCRRVVRVAIRIDHLFGDVCHFAKVISALLKSAVKYLMLYAAASVYFVIIASFAYKYITES